MGQVDPSAPTPAASGPAQLTMPPNHRPGPTPASGPQLVVCRPSADALANGPLRCLGTLSPPPATADIQGAPTVHPGQCSNQLADSSPLSSHTDPHGEGAGGPKASRRQRWGRDADPAGEALGRASWKTWGPVCPAHSRGLAQCWGQSCFMNLRLRQGPQQCRLCSQTSRVGSLEPARDAGHTGLALPASSGGNRTCLPGQSGGLPWAIRAEPSVWHQKLGTL